jgi:hypothetical protein
MILLSKRFRPGEWILPWAILLACVFIDLGTFHRRQHGDSLVPVLESLYRWQPFFWGQDRFGMLVPLLAMPFKHPLANLLVQSGINMVSTLAALFLISRYLSGRYRYVVPGGIAAILLLSLAHWGTHNQLFTPELPYAASLALSAGGLLFLRCGLARHRWWQHTASILWIVMGSFCLLLAVWVNVAVIFVISSLAVVGPSWFAVRALRYPWPANPPFAAHVRRLSVVFLRRTALPLVVATIGITGVSLLARSTPTPHTSMELTPISLWPWCVQQMMISIFNRDASPKVAQARHASKRCSVS